MTLSGLFAPAMATEKLRPGSELDRVADAVDGVESEPRPKFGNVAGRNSRPARPDAGQRKGGKRCRRRRPV